MSRWDDGLGVNSDDADDIEIGCLAFSKTHTGAGDFPRGGTVIGLNLDGDDSVLSIVTMRQLPGRLETFEINRSDIDLETVEYYGRNARTAAEIINRWLGSNHAPRDYRIRALWQRTALELAEAGAAGQWLPKAEIRFRRHEAAKAAS